MIKKIRNAFMPQSWMHTDPARAKIDWLIRLRWIAVILQALGTIPALYWGYLDPRFFFVFDAVIATIAGFNLFSHYFYRHSRPVGDRDVLIQLIFDLGGVSTLLLLTGGTWNPLSSLIFLHAGIGALLLRGKQTLLFFAFLIFCIVFIHTRSDFPRTLQPGPIPRWIVLSSYIFVALVIWRMMSWLSGMLSSLQRHVEVLRENRARMDRLRAMGALASGFSHEFSTPLNTIKLRLERLRRRTELQMDPDLETALSAVSECESKLRSLNDSRMQRSQLSLSQVSLSQLVVDVATDWSLQYPALKFAIGAKALLDDTVSLPLAAFTQIILNLLDNAVEACGNDGSIRIQFIREGQALGFRIHDNGTGFPELVFRQWGEPFVTTKVQGTGLGLFNTLSLAQALGGDLKASNPPEGGACVELRIPYAQADSQLEKPEKKEETIHG